MALCHGWVDTQTKGIDGDRYAIRFVPAVPGPTGRPPAATGSGASWPRALTPAGQAMLPPDLER